MSDAENRFIDALHQFGIDNARQHIEKIDSKMLANLANAANVRNSNLKDFIDKEKEIISDDQFLETMAEIENYDDEMSPGLQASHSRAKQHLKSAEIENDNYRVKVTKATQIPQSQGSCQMGGIKVISPEERERILEERSIRRMKTDSFIEDVENEFAYASQKHKKFTSYHEGLAVIWEEFEELKQEIFKKKPDEDNLNSELVQIAAMCLKFYENLM